MSKPRRRAVTPEEKREVVARLLALWLRNPELRLGQLVCSAQHCSPGETPHRDPFYIEDFELLACLENVLQPPGEKESDGV